MWRRRRRWKRGGASDEEMEEVKALEEEGEAEAPEQAAFGMEDALVHFELAQAEEATERHAIFESI